MPIKRKAPPGGASRREPPPAAGQGGAYEGASRSTPGEAGAGKLPRSLVRFRALGRRAEAGGPPDRVQAQKQKGKLLARERLALLLDDGSFSESGLFVRSACRELGGGEGAAFGDGVVAGFGRVDGRPVAVFAQDFTVLGGSLGLAHARKIARLMDGALRARVPVIGLMDSGGARIQEGVDALDGYGAIFAANVRASGAVPQLSAVLGPCAGGAVYSPALTDFVFMVDGLSHMFVTGPQVVKAATGQEVGFDELGGAPLHAAESGVCHFLAASEQDCLRQLRELMSYLPSSRWESPPAARTGDPPERGCAFLERLCALDARRAYEAREAVAELADDGKLFEVHRRFARNLLTGFIRLGGRPVGVVANNPAQLAGALDGDASEKAARFVRLLDCFNLPILTLVDVPGYWPGVEAERGGIIRRGAKLIDAYARATVPKVTVVLRKAFGGAYIAMGSKGLGADFNLALPCAEIAVMGAAGAVGILHGRRLRACPDPEAARAALCAEYAGRFVSPYPSAASGSLDAIVEPRRLRAQLVRCFELLKDKRRPGEGAGRGNPPA